MTPDNLETATPEGIREWFERKRSYANVPPEAMSKALSVFSLVEEVTEEEARRAHEMPDLEDVRKFFDKNK